MLKEQQPKRRRLDDNQEDQDKQAAQALVMLLHYMQQAKSTRTCSLEGPNRKRKAYDCSICNIIANIT